jgi:hypothetical protein
MPSPDSLKIKVLSPIPSKPEFDLEGNMLTKDATTKDCLFTMTEYLSENVLQSIPKEFRIKQFFDKGLFKSFRKQNPYNIPVKEDNKKKPESAKEDNKKKAESAREDETKKQEAVKESAKEDNKKKAESAREDETKKQEAVKESAKEDNKKKPESTPSSDENLAGNRELISTYRKIINHNIRLILNTLFQKNNKIVIKGNTYTIGYYNWTDYDWDIDAKRPTFDKQQYVTSEYVKQQLKKIPPILKHGLITTNDKLNAEDDFFDVKGFANEEEAVKTKALETLGLKQGQTKRDIIEFEQDDAEKSRLESIKVEKARKTLGLVPLQSRPNGVVLKPPVAIKLESNSTPKIPDQTSTVPELEVNQPNITPSEDNNTVSTVVPETEFNQQNITSSEGNTVNETTKTLVGGETNENKSDSFDDSRRSSFDLRNRQSFDSRRRYDPRYDPRYSSHNKMVRVDESNFAIFISVELYLVKGDTLTPEDESNLNCKNNWNKVLVPFDKLIGREKRGILPDYSLEPTSKPDESPKPNGSTPTAKETTPTAKETTPTAKETTPTAKETTPTAKETTPTAKETIPTAKEPTAHGGARYRSKTHRRKKRKTVKKNKHKKRRAFRTTRKRKLRGCSVRK